MPRWYETDRHCSNGQSLTHCFRVAILQVLACAQLKNLGTNSAGMKCAEVAAFCVDPSYRNGGRGDSLLDYIEQKAREQGYDYLVLLTTRTADWFCCRGFKEAGVAFEAEILPASRREKVGRPKPAWHRLLLLPLLMHVWP